MREEWSEDNMSSHGTVNGEQLQRAAWDKHGWLRGAREVEVGGNQGRCGLAQHGGGSTACQAGQGDPLKNWLKEGQ